MKAVNRNILALAVATLAVNAVAQITLFEREGFSGQSFTTDRPVSNFDRRGFNDRASSVVVSNDRWEVCDDAWFKGRCVVLRPGKYPSLAAMGLDERISSVRGLNDNVRIDENRYAPLPRTDYDTRRRSPERLYEANVSSVHAVVGPPDQRCWVEREQVPQERSKANVPGAIAGAFLGGILGHQVGGGRGKDLATVGGAVAGAAVGSNVGRDADSGTPETRDVRHCESTPSQARPEFWDVTYTFRGQEHRVQLTTPPGATISVNEKGEPRS